jgi:hypothetical protein
MLILTQDRCKVCAECAIGLGIILATPDGNFSMTWVKWKHVLVHLEIVLISLQDMGTIFAECSMGIEIFLVTHDEPPR